MLPSPDVPAYLCYGVVLLVGALVALAKVNEPLSVFSDRWAFAGTWQLFLAYTLLPVILFLFLDYVSVIQDTSLFAALLIAVGYQQLLVGGRQDTIQNISIPEPVVSLWKPFKAWVDKLIDRIATKQKQYYDYFDEITQRD